MNEIAIKLTNISKKFFLRHEKPTLMETFFKQKEEFWALRNINFEVTKRQKLGIIGLNGAGKSTLLKIICGITAPTRGRVEVRGKTAALIELTAGFHPDLTGEENIYINGLLLGMSRKEIKDKFKAIVDFSGLHHFIDAPFYTYSGGMMLRLGFSVAIHSNPDILIVDEIISAGDQYFQEKCQKRVEKFFKEKTVLFASHNLEMIKLLYPNSIWLERGRIKAIGKTHKIVKAYLESQRKS